LKTDIHIMIHYTHTYRLVSQLNSEKEKILGSAISWSKKKYFFYKMKMYSSLMVVKKRVAMQ